MNRADDLVNKVGRAVYPEGSFEHGVMRAMYAMLCAIREQRHICSEKLAQDFLKFLPGERAEAKNAETAVYQVLGNYLGTTYWHR